MRKVNSIDDIVRIKEDHRIKDLVSRTSNHQKKMKGIGKKNSTLSSSSINKFDESSIKSKQCLITKKKIFD
jgi:hypothetical protein